MTSPNTHPLAIGVDAGNVHIVFSQRGFGGQVSNHDVASTLGCHPKTCVNVGTVFRQLDSSNVNQDNVPIKTRLLSKKAMRMASSMFNTVSSVNPCCNPLKG